MWCLWWEGPDPANPHYCPSRNRCGEGGRSLRDGEQSQSREERQGRGKQSLFLPLCAAWGTHCAGEEMAEHHPCETRAPWNHRQQERDMAVERVDLLSWSHSKGRKTCVPAAASRPLCTCGGWRGASRWGPKKLKKKKKASNWKCTSENIGLFCLAVTDIKQEPDTTTKRERVNNQRERQAPFCVVKVWS